MRLDFVKMFVDSTVDVFREVVGPTVDLRSIVMMPKPVAGRDVLVIIGLMGEAQGRVIIDLESSAAVSLAERMMGEPSAGVTPLVRSCMAELSSMALGAAISRINDAGCRIYMSPPTVISGANLVSYDQSYETLFASLDTGCGDVGMNITIQDLD